MFHIYVLASTGRTVDFHRARLLMDRELLRASIKAMNEAMAIGPDPWDVFMAERNGMQFDPGYGPQWIWEHYCARHWDKYGVQFGPDSDPSWDR